MGTPIAHLDGFSRNLSWLWVSSHTSEAKWGTADWLITSDLQTIDLYEAWGTKKTVIEDLLDKELISVN